MAYRSERYGQLTTSKSALLRHRGGALDVEGRQTSPPRSRPGLSQPKARLRRRRQSTPTSAAPERRGQLLAADLHHRDVRKGFFLIPGRKSICEVLFAPAWVPDRATEPLTHFVSLDMLLSRTVSSCSRSLLDILLSFTVLLYSHVRLDLFSAPHLV